jgi:hypothetical protein
MRRRTLLNLFVAASMATLVPNEGFGAEVPMERIAFGEGYSITALNGAIQLNTEEKIVSPGIAILHCNLNSGEMSCLMSSGIYLPFTREMHRVLRRVLGTTQDKERIAILTMVADLGDSNGFGDYRLREAGNIDVRISVYDKASGKKLEAKTLDFPEIREIPEETIDETRIKFVEGGLSVWGKSHPLRSEQGDAPK